RYATFNVWMPLEIVEDNPLAVCNSHDIEFNDKKEMRLWEYKENHQWVYLSNQSPSQDLVFTQHDNQLGVQFSVPHPSVMHPRAKKQACPRKSFEVGILVVF
ncbi:hypothetical protein CROQUDRAFT_27974, partial [Cronartium quercuum f. sp. fusiforme G11]